MLILVLIFERFAIDFIFYLPSCLIIKNVELKILAKLFLVCQKSISSNNSLLLKYIYIFLIPFPQRKYKQKENIPGYEANIFFLS